jgi:hypothetical protein
MIQVSSLRRDFRFWSHILGRLLAYSYARCFPRKQPFVLLRTTPQWTHGKYDNSDNIVKGSRIEYSTNRIRFVMVVIELVIGSNNGGEDSSTSCCTSGTLIAFLKKVLMSYHGGIHFSVVGVMSVLALSGSRQAARHHHHHHHHIYNKQTNGKSVVFHETQTMRGGARRSRRGTFPTTRMGYENASRRVLLPPEEGADVRSVPRKELHYSLVHDGRKPL